MHKLLIVSICLFILAACQKPLKIKTAKVIVSNVESTVSSLNSGMVRAEKVAELAFGTVGRVKTLNVKLGDLVKKGDVLAEVENTDLKTTLEMTQANLDRITTLSKTQAMSQSSLEDAENAFRAAESNFRKSQIIAPYDGLIAEQNIELGQLSQITAVIPKALIRIVDQLPRYIRAEIDEVDLSKVKIGMPARVKILAERKETFGAKVRTIVPFVSTIREQDRTVEVELDVENEGILLPAGASAAVEIITSTKDNVLSLPMRAILGRGDDRFVFKVESDVIKKTPVKLGIFNYDIAEIVEGLKDGETVAMPSEGVELKDSLKILIDN